MAENPFAMEFEEISVIALIGVLLVPGFMWIAKGPTTASKIRRAVVIGTVVTTAALIESALDRTAASVAETLE